MSNPSSVSKSMKQPNKHATCVHLEMHIIPETRVCTIEVGCKERFLPFKQKSGFLTLIRIGFYLMRFFNSFVVRPDHLLTSHLPLRNNFGSNCMSCTSCHVGHVLRRCHHFGSVAIQAQNAFRLASVLCFVLFH